MHFHTALRWWWMNILTRRRYDLLLRHFRDLEEAYQALHPGMLRELGCRPETVEEVMNRLDVFDPARYAAEMERRTIHLVSIEDAEYPAALQDLPDAPVFLSYRGDLSLLSLPLVAIVGTRAMSGYGQRIVRRFVPDLVRAGVVTVSGLALGVDAEVAGQTLAGGGRTVAVLGSGLASVFPPANKELAEEIVRQGGLLLSEYPLELPPGTHTFPSRNRIIAGLAAGTLVCEAPEKSGSVITAECAFSYGRKVFAVPGSIFDEHFFGCHRLIAEGHAALVRDAKDLLLALSMVPPSSEQAYSFTPSSSDEDVVYRVLTALPQHMDDVAERAKLPVARLGVVLTMLELAGVAENLGNGQWVRK